MALPTVRELVKELNSRGIFPVDFDYQFLPGADPNTTAKSVIDEIIVILGKQDNEDPNG